MNDLITLIVPIHNGEKWLYRCFDSIARQSIKAFQVVAILDACTDNSGGELKKYAGLLNMRVYNVNFRVVGKVRNFGIELTNTPYLSFVDCDDVIIDDYIKNCYSCIFSNNPNQNIYTFKMTGRDNLNTNELIQNSCVARLYKTDFLNFYNVRFPALPTLEDVLFMNKCFCYNLLDTGGSVSHCEVDAVMYQVFASSCTEKTLLYKDFNNEQRETACQYVDEYLQTLLQVESDTGGLAYVVGITLTKHALCNHAKEILRRLPKLVRHRIYQNTRNKSLRKQIKSICDGGGGSLFRQITYKQKAPN